MKIVVLIHSLSMGGAERVTSSLVNYWAEKGWDITVVTISGDEVDFYVLHPRVQRVVLNLGVDSISLISAIKHNFIRICALRRVFKKIQPEVVLGMMTTANCLLSVASRGMSVVTIGSERIYPPLLPIGRAWSWLRKKTYPRLSAVVAQTEKSGQWLRQEAPMANVAVIPNPVVFPLLDSDPRVPLCRGKGKKILLAVGRLVEQKGFDRLISAFSDLAPQFEEWDLVIVGEGEERELLESMVADSQLVDRVCLPGAVGNVGNWYESSDLYVLASRFEGFPNTLIEALSYGLPAISVDCDTGPRDIVRHEVDGLLVPQNDHQALVSALARLMENKVLRQQYAKRAIDARERFSEKRIAGMWEVLFQKAVGHSNVR